MQGNLHVQCGVGENPEIISEDYLSLFYRVKFGVPATNLQTKGDSITFQTPTIEGTVMRRNKVDGLDKHPWKAEVTEGESNVSDGTISEWFSEVYEPVFEEGV